MLLTLEDYMTLSASPSAIIETQPHTPETFRKGEEFEDYVRKYLFPKGIYGQIDRTHHYLYNIDDFI